MMSGPRSRSSGARYDRWALRGLTVAFALVLFSLSGRAAYADPNGPVTDAGDGAVGRDAGSDEHALSDGGTSPANQGAAQDGGTSPANQGAAQDGGTSPANQGAAQDGGGTGSVASDAAAPVPGLLTDAGAGLDAASVDGQAPETPAALGEVVVTGVRGSQPRSVADSPVPIDIINHEELQDTGRTGLKEILGGVTPAFDEPAQAGGGTSASVRPYSYRGLSGDYLLVLVNGKRRHTTALINNLALISGGSTPVDLDLIPTSSVSRIEILRDGAAAQYGSDAISGVMNIILDDDPHGLKLTETAGSTYHQAGQLLQQTASYGVPLGDQGGFLRLSAEGKLHDPSTSSASPLPAVNAQGGPNYYYTPYAAGVPNVREPEAAGRVFAGGYGRSDRDIILNTSYNAELPVDKDWRLYSFSTFSFRDVKDARGAFSANNINSLPQIYPDGFQAYRRIWEFDGQAALGAKGDAAGWDWDLSGAFGRDNVKLGAEDTLNPSLGPSSPTTFFMGRQIQNLFVDNLDISKPVPIGFADPLQVSFGVEHRWEEFQNQAGEPDSYFNGGYVIPILPCGGTAATCPNPFNQVPLAKGVGGFGGLAPSPGLASFSGTTPADAVTLTRNNLAGYVDLFTKVTKAWEVGLAGRAEHYTDSAGNTAAGKLSTRVELAPGLALRGGVNNGFRAPALAQTGFSTTQFTATIIQDQRVTTVSKFLPVDSPAAIALGAQPLKPEHSVDATTGITYEPSRNLRFTADGYFIQIDDRIVKTDFIGTSNNGGAAIKSLLATYGVTGVDSAQYFTNAINTQTWGTDIVAEYTLRSDTFGTFRPNAALAYASTHITHVIATPPQLAALNVVPFGRQGQIDLVRGTPRDKVVVDLDWKIGRVHSNLRFSRYDSYIEASTTAGFDVTYGAKVITDLDVAYQLTDNVTFALGAYNLFDVYPDKNGPISAVDGSGQYGSFSPFGFTGGFYYARLSAEF
jgi:iron complex outermembrane receptor protein